MSEDKRLVSIHVELYAGCDPILCAPPLLSPHTRMSCTFFHFICAGMHVRMICAAELCRHDAHFPHDISSQPLDSTKAARLRRHCICGHEAISIRHGVIATAQLVFPLALVSDLKRQIYIYSAMWGQQSSWCRRPWIISMQGRYFSTC